MLKKIVIIEQMREIEDRSELAGVSKDTLMEVAGLAVARRVRRHIGHLIGVPILVLVGPGNNGGDGLVTARHLHNWGAGVVVYICRDRREPDPKLDIVRDQGQQILHASDDDGLSKLKALLSSAHMVVDSVLGTGRARPMEGTIRSIFRELAQSQSGRDALPARPRGGAAGHGAAPARRRRPGPRAAALATGGRPLARGARSRC